MPASAKAGAWFPQGRWPCGGARVCQCHFLPSALEKTNRLNCLHMLLRGAEGGGARALPVKENTFKPCCRIAAPITGPCGSLLGTRPGIQFSRRGRYPRPHPRPGERRTSLSPFVSAFFLGGGGGSIKEFQLREKWGERQSVSWEPPNLRNEAQIFTLGEALLWSSVSPSVKGSNPEATSQGYWHVALHKWVPACLWVKERSER